MVFDKIKFQRFVSNKSFLPDSYTAFKNKIGLTINDHTTDNFINSKDDIVLAWSHKDCLLEGGQTKEDQKRNEIFWNETLSPDNIDRILDPKVLTNFKRYDKDGEHTLTELKGDENMILKGNNLLALASLLETHRGKIKLIYIDPPYNTGNDGFKYNDNFNHSTWLTFMKNRLGIAKELLKDDGVIFVQCDDNEQAYLKVLMDEIFGRDHFREVIVLKSSTESGVNAINVKRGERLFKVKEYILFYSRCNSFRFNPFYIKTNFNTNYRYEVIKNKFGSGYKVIDLSKKFKEKYGDVNISKKEKDFLVAKEFENYALTNAKNIYSLEKNIKKAGDKFKAFALSNKEKGIVEEYVNSLGNVVLIYGGGVFVPLKERIVNEGNKNYFGVLASDLWLDIGTTPSSEGGIKLSNGKKPEKLLSRIINMATQPNDIVLDYHLGSGTTAAVAHKMGRRYIGIEQMDYIETIAVERLKKVIAGEQGGISKSVKWQGGGSFIYAELMQYNQKYIDQIQKATTRDELLKIWETMHQKAFLSYRFDKFTFNKRLEAFKTAAITKMKWYLIEILDKNQLYVNYSEIEDQSYQVNTKDKKLNNLFYKNK